MKILETLAGKHADYGRKGEVPRCGIVGSVSRIRERLNMSGEENRYREERTDLTEKQGNREHKKNSWLYFEVQNSTHKIILVDSVFKF